MADGLSILMPVFNERSTVEAAIDDALNAELPVDSRELVLVDDGSTDGTRELLQSRAWPENVTVVLHPRNRGKGAAVRTALQHATMEFAAILDADLEYRAADLADVLEPLVSGEARVVFGTRAWTSQSSFSFWYVMGNKSVTMATNVIYNCWISDVMTCHKAMRTELFRSLPAPRARIRDRAGDRRARTACRRADPRGADLVPRPLARSREEAHGRRRAPRPADAPSLSRDVSDTAVTTALPAADAHGRLVARVVVVAAYAVLGVTLSVVAARRSRQELLVRRELLRRPLRPQGPGRDPHRAGAEPRAVRHPRVGGGPGRGRVGDRVPAALRRARSSPGWRSSRCGCTGG